MSQPSKTEWTRRQMLDRTVRAGAGLGIAAGSGLALAGCGGDDGPAKGLSAAEAARRLPELAATLRRVSGVPGMAWAVVQGTQTLAAQGLVSSARRGRRSGTSAATTPRPPRWWT